MSCSNLKPSVCGGTMNPQIPDGNNCNTSVRIVGANNVSIKQGNEIDLRSGVKAYDGNGAEIPFTVSPTSIEKCDVGVHKITYTAEGEGADSLPHLSCGGNRVFAKACNTVRRVVERLVTVVKANNPVINGLSKVTLPVGGSLSPLSGVTAYDDNGNQLSVSYSGKKANVASGEIASFDDSTGEDALSLEVTLSPIQDLHGYDAPWVHDDNEQVPYKFRASNVVSEVGNSIFDKIVGGTVAWNQLVQNGDFADDTGWGTRFATVSIADGIATFTPSSEGTVRGIVQGNMGEYAKANHKYLGLATVKPPKQVQMNLSIVGSGGGRTIIPANAWTTFGQVFTYSNPNFKERLAIYCDTNLTTSDTVQVRNAQLFDLTAMFGTTIADYIYSLEQANAGAGVAWFKKLFPKDYYEYNAGELLSVEGLESHDTVGFNQWDEEWEVGRYDTDGTKTNTSDAVRAKNYIPCFPNTVYYFRNGTNNGGRVCWYDADKQFISTQTNFNTTKTSPSGAHFLTISTNIEYGTTYKHDICINLSSPSRNGEYEEYIKHSYPLDNSLTLRGVPKLDSFNNLYYDGDEYASDGSVTRKYATITITASDVPAEDSGYIGTVSYKGKDSVWIRNFKYVTGIETFRTASSSGFDGRTTKFDVAINDGSYYSSQYRTVFIGIASREALITAIGSGLDLVYELATPTTETATAYTNPQTVDAYGTEEYVTTSIVPVGHITDHANICPITGYDTVSVIVSPTTNASDGTTYTTTLPQTVYGGTLDMVSGELVVDRAMVDLGTLDWRVSYPELSEGHAYRALFQQMAINPNLLVPSEYAYKRNGSTTVIASNIKDGECWAQNSASWVWIRDDRYYTAEDFKTAMSGVQLVYPLATPQTYQLTPQQIQTLLGQNNVWSDGDSVEIKYMATINQSGDIEYPVEGTFSLNYTATDECGNTTTKIRTVYVGEFTYRTVLYSDGTFIVNEASTDMEDNIAEHGEAVGVYEPYKTPNDYIFNGATQRPWHAFSQNVTRVEIGSPIKPVFMSYWFSYFANATSFDLTKLDTEDTVYMNYTFYRCSSVKELDLSNFETSKVVNYNNMFGEDYSLEAIYASDSFAITGTPSSSNMFEQCNSIIGGSGTAYDANHIDAEYARFDNAPTTPGYFRNVNTTYRTVIYVDKTMIINESSEDTLNNIAKHGSATNVYEPMNADGSNYVFYYNGPNSRPWDAQASQVRRVEVGSPIKPTDTSFWFHLFTNCTDIDMTNMDTSLADKMYYMFAYCHSLENITYGGFSTANATDIGGMFVDCRSLAEIQAWRMDTSKVQYAPSVFSGCSALANLDVTTWDTSDMVVMDAMFKGMTLETIDLSNFDTSSAESMREMFSDSSFEVLDLSSFDTSSITYVLNQRGGIASMFAGCSQLETIYASNKFDVTHLPQGSEGRRDTFDGCVALVGGAGTTYSETWGEYARIDNPPSLPGYFTGKGTTYRTVIYSDKTLIINEASTDIEANTASHGNAEYTYPPMSEANPYVFEDAQDRPWSGLASYVEHVEFGSVVQPTSTAYWFFGSAALEDFDPTNLDTSNTTKMNYMFYNCAGFESFFLNIDTSKVTDMSNMFNSCRRLKTLDLSSFDTRSLTSMRNMFNACYVLETIYATDKFDVTNVNEEWVFVSNDHLVGGGGTAYASGKQSSEYARIDNPPTAPGYFTAK